MLSLIRRILGPSRFPIFRITTRKQLGAKPAKIKRPDKDPKTPNP